MTSIGDVTEEASKATDRTRVGREEGAGGQC